MTTSDQPILLAAVSVLSAIHMGFMTRRVGWSRMKFKIMPPIVTGPPEFERTFRAQQNAVEFYPVFLVLLWTSGIFCNEGFAALGGLIYIVAREMYFTGYVNSAQGRLPGFYVIICVILTQSCMAMFSISLLVLDKYLNIRIF